MAPITLVQRTVYRLMPGIVTAALGASLWGILPAQAQRPSTPNLATVIKVCVNGLIFRNIFADGTPGGPTTGVTQTDAAIACRGVGSLAEARQVKLCVNGLLFTSITDDGLPAGQRTDITPRNAAIACSICTNNLRGDRPWGGDFAHTSFPNRKRDLPAL